MQRFKQFQTNVPFIYPLKTSESLWFSDIFWGYRKGTLAWNGLTRQLKYPAIKLFIFTDGEKRDEKRNILKRKISAIQKQTSNDLLQ